MINNYIVALMLCFIVNGEIYPNEQTKNQQEIKLKNGNNFIHNGRLEYIYDFNGKDGS